VKSVSGNEVLIKGKVNNPRGKDRIEKLTVKEPDKDAYERQVALDGENRFELTLGPPKPGTYSVSLEAQRKYWLAGTRNFTLAAPNLEIPADSSDSANQSPSVQASDVDFQRLFLLPSLTAVFAAILLILAFHPPARADAEQMERAALAK
jgi:hypothetical protein